MGATSQRKLCQVLREVSMKSRIKTEEKGDAHIGSCLILLLAQGPVIVPVNLISIQVRLQLHNLAINAH